MSHIINCYVPMTLGASPTSPCISYWYGATLLLISSMKLLET